VIDTAMVEIKTVHYGSDVKKIGVLADTHIPTRGRFMPPHLFRIFNEVQLIMHAGDLVDEQVLIELQALAPVEAVAGNMDPPDLRSRLGRQKLLDIGGVVVALLHGDLAGHRVSHERLSEQFKPIKPRVIVFGHLHEPVNEWHDDILFFNPGSAVDPRRSPNPSCGLLKIENTQVSGEILYF
jgi:uncharacterized protein